MIRRVADLTAPPVVGQVYLVTCVRAPRGDWLPTLGPIHEDPSFAPALGPHVHYDPRFLDLSQVRVRIDGLPPEQACQVIAHRVFTEDMWAACDGLSRQRATRWATIFAERPLICLREMPPFPRGHESAPWVGTLEAAHRACRVGLSGRCPHAGTDGRSLPRDAAGTWTCIHGLRWGRGGELV